MIKFYRTACFRQIGGFVRELMWDGIDGHRCRQLGWIAISDRPPADALRPPPPDGHQPQELVDGPGAPRLRPVLHGHDAGLHARQRPLPHDAAAARDGRPRHALRLLREGHAEAESRATATPSSGASCAGTSGPASLPGKDARHGDPQRPPHAALGSLGRTGRLGQPPARRDPGADLRARPRQARGGADGAARRARGPQAGRDPGPHAGPLARRRSATGSPCSSA